MAEVTLRAIEHQDLFTIWDWRNSDKVRPYCREYRYLSMKDMEVWFEGLHRCNDMDYNLSSDFYILKYSDADVGVGGFTRIDWRNRKAELSFYIGATAFSKERIIDEALPVLLHYGFGTLNMHKIIFPVYSNNPYLEIYKKHLTQEYVAKDEYYWEGYYHDRIILTRYQPEVLKEI